MAYLSKFYDSIPGDSPDNQWKTPLILAIGLHLLVLLLSLVPSSLFYSRPEMPEVITINLLNVEEPRLPKAEPKKLQPPKTPVKIIQKKRTPPPPPPSPLPEKPVTSISQEVQPTPAAAPEKLVSLSPRKIKKKPPQPVTPKKDTKEADRLKALERIQARVNKKKEDEKIIHNLAKLRESLHTLKPAIQPVQETEEPVPPTDEPAVETDQPSAPSTGSTELMDMALKRYYIAVSRKIHKHWILPPMQNWDTSLQGIIVVIIRKDGSIINTFFEKKSNNTYFNQFVEQTIREAAPLPHFPSDLKETKLEIGLRFSPGGLY